MALTFDTGPPLHARLDKSGLSVLRGVGDCGYCLAWVLDLGVPISGLKEWARAVWFPPGWVWQRDGTWTLSSYAVRRLRRGLVPKLRREISTLNRGVQGWLPWNLPITAVCPGCGRRQVLHPVRLNVSPHANPWDQIGGAGRTLEFPADLARWELTRRSAQR